MLNITVLKKFPVELWNEFKEYYNNNYKNKTPELQWSEVHLADVIPTDDLNYFRKKFEDIVPIDGIEVYTVLGPKRMAPHIDRGRTCALQIPVDVDPANNYTYAINTDDYEHLVKVGQDHSRKDVKNIVNNVDHFFFNWDPLFYDTYNLEYPVLQNVSVPHGGHNLNNSVRRFISLTIKTTPYTEAKEMLKLWT
jgi:hypothetical protein